MGSFLSTQISIPGHSVLVLLCRVPLQSDTYATHTYPHRDRDSPPWGRGSGIFLLLRRESGYHRSAEREHEPPERRRSSAGARYGSDDRRDCLSKHTDPNPSTADKDKCGAGG